jgi:hypothetical protein
MQRILGTLLFVSLVAFVGCSKPGPTTPALAPVKGKVNLDGKAMGGGEIRFGVAGQPVKTLPIKDGTFEGQVFAGQNVIEVLWEKDGPPHPMDPNQRMKINTVAPKYSGPNSPLNKTIDASGASDLKFDVTTK